MASRRLLQSVMAARVRRPLTPNLCFPSFSATNCLVSSLGKSNFETVKVDDFPAIRRDRFFSSRDGASEDGPDEGSLHEAPVEPISEVSRTEGWVGQTTNLLIGGTAIDDATDEWFALDKKVNSYPNLRGFIAIGTGGHDFVQSMVVAVESVMQQSIPEGQVRQRLSSKGKYVSVKIGPIPVVSSEQVQAVYKAMWRDNRIKYFL